MIINHSSFPEYEAKQEGEQKTKKGCYNQLHPYVGTLRDSIYETGTERTDPSKQFRKSRQLIPF